jgi:Uma2 family endonuclease
MAAVMEQQTKRWTYEEYYRLEDDQRYEIIDGNLLMVPAPETSHQDWLNNLTLIVTPFVRAKKLGRIFIAPTDVVLDQHNTVQPDLIFISKAKVAIIKNRAIFGTPDLLVEFISPSGMRRDRYVKKEIYARFGVQEYWIGDAANQTLEVLTLKQGAYELFCCAEVKGKITSLVLPGLEFDLAQLTEY